MEDLKNHWEKIYSEKETTSFSWYQEIPTTSINFLKKYCPTRSCSVIDIGGGDTSTARYLRQEGFHDLSVLDISSKAIERAKNNFGEEADKVDWIVSDILAFQPQKKYKLWHDRAAFHFLTSEKDIKQYAQIAADSIPEGGHLIIGTFSEKGPLKCSGIEIKQYNKESLNHVFKNNFNLLETEELQHITPTGKEQHFIFCAFERK